MACSTPVIMTSMGSRPELVEDGVSGLLSNPSSPDEIAESITKLLEDARFRTKLGEGGRKRALDLF